MAGDLPPSAGGESTPVPPSGQWMPPYAPQSVARPFAWPAIALSAIAAVVAVAALLVALTKPTASVPTMAPGVPTYTAAETAEAHQKLCAAYKLAARAVQIETNGASPERAGIAEVNGAMMLREALDSAPAIAAGDRDAAIALANAYNNVAVRATLATGSGDPAWRSALDDANANDTAMKKVCGG